MSIVRLYEEIVGRGGVSPAYFFDRMTFEECESYLDGLHHRDRTELERIRLLMWASIQPHSRKRYELDDILKLDELSEPEPMDEKELNELRKRAKQLEYGKYIYPSAVRH